MTQIKRTAVQELPPLQDSDCIYAIERKKSEFSFPIHYHSQYEINYVENASGARRIVGDSIEEIGDYDLVLISGENLEHSWQTHNCTTQNIREITIQFSKDWLESGTLSKKQFHSIQKMFEDGRNGLLFPLSTILKTRSLLNSLIAEQNGFYSVITFMSLLYELSISKNTRMLASTSFAQTENTIMSRRILAVDQYLRDNYSQEVRLNDMARLVNMSEVSFSRFFMLRTGRNFTDYLTNIRIGHVARLLVDSNKTISEICYECGYNNLSNFNRIFKKIKGYSPTEFRRMYQKKQVIF